MTLKEKIDTINRPEVKPFDDGSNTTIKEFFDEFVLPRLPGEDCIKKWHKLLMEYTDESNFDKISCCVRYGNVGTKARSKYGETGYYKLRRGWLTRNNDDNFEYFFADNFFSHFIYKMALDGFCPEPQEFEDAFRKHEFPYGFGFMIDEKINEYKGVKIKTAREPGFLGKYKLSHVFDSGENFLINGVKYLGKADKQLSDLYYDIGHSNDFLTNSDHVRVMNIDSTAKKVIVAKFLRFVHPFNYFLTPRKKAHTCGGKVYKKDIGEDPEMISYVKAYLKKTYPNEFKEFVEKILWLKSPNVNNGNGNTIINIAYSNDKIKNSNQNSHNTDKKYKNRRIRELVQKYIKEKNIASFNELNVAFPRIALLAKDVKDATRYFEDEKALPNGDVIRITNQIGDTPSFPQNRNYTKLSLNSPI